MAKRTEEAAKMAGLIARKTGAPIEGSFEGNLQALINALNLHKVSNDHDQFSHVWTGVNQFLQTLETAGIMPVEGDTADIGSPTRPFRKGFFSELSTLIFKKGNVLVMDGMFVLTKQSGKFPADVAAGDTQIDFGQTLTVGDFLLLRAENKMEYMQVGSLVDGTTYNVTRNLDGSGANDWPRESVYFVRGHEGDGWLELTAVDDLRMSVFTQGQNWNQNKEVVRVGKLDGWQGAVDLMGYGLAAGSYADKKYIYLSTVSYGGVTARYIAASGNVGLDDNGVTIGVNKKIVFKNGDIDSPDEVGSLGVFFPGEFNNAPTVTLTGRRVTGYSGGVDIKAYGGAAGGFGIVAVNPGEIRLGTQGIEAEPGKAMAIFDRDGLTLDKDIAAANIVTTPGASKIPRALTDGKLDAGWLPNLSGLYLPIGGKAADADKLDGIDSTGFVRTSGNQTVAGIKTFSSIPVLPATNPTTANQAVRKGYADATYLGITARAADSDKLDGLDSTAFLRVPTWQAWTPAVSYLGGTTNPTSLTFDHARYCRTGDTVTFSIVATVVRGSGNRTVVTFSLPITAKYANFAASGTEDVTSTTPKACGCYSDTAKRVLVRFATAMANNGKIRVSGSYEV